MDCHKLPPELIKFNILIVSLHTLFNTNTILPVKMFISFILFGVKYRVNHEKNNKTTNLNLLF